MGLGRPTAVVVIASLIWLLLNSLILDSLILWFPVKKREDLCSLKIAGRSPCPSLTGFAAANHAMSPAFQSPRFGPFITRGVSLDISTQGMSVLVCGAPRVGETVVIELPLRDALIDMLATVRHSTDSKSGFEFCPLSASAQDGIQRWLSELRQHEESLFPCSYFAGSRTGTD
jgi:hypothetical protein